MGGVGAAMRLSRSRIMVAFLHSAAFVFMAATVIAGTVASLVLT